MRVRTRTGIVLAAAAFVASGAGVRAAAPVWSLVDPVSGAAVEVRPDAAATHLVFFATWCPPCRDELGPLGEIAARWEDRGYRLVLVAVRNRQSVERLAEFEAGGAVPGRLLFDAEGALQSELAVEHLPAHVVLDARGAVVRRSGALDDGVRETIERLVGGRRPAGRAP